MTILAPQRLILAAFAAVVCLTFFSSVASAATYQVRSDTQALTPLSSATALFSPNVDDNNIAVNLPFTVRTNTQSYTQLTISANGFFGYGNVAGNNSFVNYTFDDNVVPPTPIVHVHAADHIDAQGVLTQVSGTAPNRRYTIQWTSRNYPNTGGSTTISQAILYENSTRVETLFSANNANLNPGRYGFKLAANNVIRNGSAQTRAYPAANTRETYVTFSVDIAGRTNDTTPTFTGIGNDGGSDIVVNVYAGGDTTDTPLFTEIRPEGPNYESTITSALDEGNYTVVATQTEADGTTVDTDQRAFAVDTTAPTVSTSTLSRTKNTRPTVTGTAGITPGDNADVQLQAWSGTDTTGTPTYTATGPVNTTDGSYSVQFPSVLSEGTYTYRVVQTDTAGNAGQTIDSTFVVDTTAPTVVVDAPADNVNDSTPAITGKLGRADGDNADGQAVIFSYAANANVQTFPVVANTDGTFSVDVPTALVDGAYVVTVEQNDGLNGGFESKGFTVDTVAPTVEIGVGPPARTQDNQPTITGLAGTAANDSPNVQLQAWTGTDTTGTPASTTDAPVNQTDGSYSVQFPAELADGTYTYRIVQTDAAGNRTQTTERTFVVDTTAPALTVTGPNDTNDTTPTVTGKLGVATGDNANATVQIYNVDTDTIVQTFGISTGQTDGSYAADLPVALAEGNYRVDVTQGDDVDNGVQVSRTFAVDTTAPAVVLNTPANATRTDDRTPTFAGTYTTETRDVPEVNVSIYAGTDTTAAPVQTVNTTTNTGEFSGVPTDDLTPGHYTAIARQVDTAGNIGASTPVEFDVVLTATDLSITANSSASSVTVGDTVNQQFTVTNNGADTDNVRLVFTAPEGTDIQSAEASPSTCTITGQTVTCDYVGQIASGDSGTLYVVLKTTKIGDATSTATISGPAEDTNTANNTASTTVQVNAAVVVTNPVAPVITTAAATVLGQHAIVFNGTINAGGDATNYYFEYGQTSNYGYRTEAGTVSGTDAVAVSAALNGLQLGTNYHYRLVAVNSAGKTVSGDQTVKTTGQLAPRKVSLQARKLTSKLPFKFRFSGKLSLPATVTAREGCSGNVNVRVQRGKTTISSRTVKLSRNCSYTSTVSFARQSRLGKDGKLTITARYLGNRALKARTASRLTVRAR